MKNRLHICAARFPGHAVASAIAFFRAFEGMEEGFRERARRVAVAD